MPRIWNDDAERLVAIWRDLYPSQRPRKHTLIEKVLCSVTIILSMVSLANLKNLFPKGSFASHEFMDLYVLSWAIVLYEVLKSGALWTPLAVGIAVYRIADIVNYRLYFLFVKSQDRPWLPEVVRRSVAIALINFYEIVMAYAILYLHTGAVVQSGMPGKTLNAGTAFYFSLVTMTTVGYGDFVPATPIGRGLVEAQVSTTILFLIFLLPAIVSVLSPGLTGRSSERGQQ